MATKTSVALGSITAALVLASTAYQEYRILMQEETATEFGESCSIVIQHLQESNFQKQELINASIDRHDEMYEDLKECYREE